MLIMSELTIEEHIEWREMTNMMLNVMVPPETFFQTIQARYQIFGKVNKVYAVRWKDVLDGIWHLVDKDGNYHNNVPSSMYYFLKDKGWTHLHLEDIAECQLVFNDWRKTLKIGAGWKHLCETLSLIADIEIVFEFIDSNVNCVLYWPCL
ncbi:hypothetical protein GmHk_08G023081 [Glycine max]|nr:hypothetical protein GmHk_08G023081 [Glycine max]